MKRLALAVTIVAGMTSGVQAQVKPAPTLSPSVAHNVDFRMRQDMIQIQRDLKAGKLGSAQASSLKAKVKSIRQEELSDLKANGNKKLTDAQKNQINSELDGIQASI